MPAELTRLPANAAVEQILEILDRDGGVIVERFLTTDRVDGMLVELGPYIQQTVPIADDFPGIRPRAPVVSLVGPRAYASC